jgi:hypothetical protein
MQDDSPIKNKVGTAPLPEQPTADGNWGEREGRSRRAKALLRVDDKK